MKQKLLLLLALLGMAMSPLLAETQDALSGYCGRQIKANYDSTNLEWSLNVSTHTLTITGSGPMKDYTSDTKAPWFNNRSDIHTVKFPDGMTTVGNYAMYDHYNLATIVWDGNTVVTIGANAFYQCRSLTALVLPSTVMSIGGSAFQYCSGLLTIKTGNLIQSLGWGTFYGCSQVQEVDLGGSPVNMDGYAFAYDNALVKITFSNVNTIRYNAFEGCRSLKSLHFPASLTSVEGNCFRGCSGLDTITVHAENTVYDSRNDCNAVIRKSDNRLIVGSNRTVIPNNVLSIGDDAFYDRTRLTSIVLPNGLQYIGSHAFQNCSQLSSINFPESITSVGCGVFKYCSGLATPICNATCFAYMPPSYEGSYALAPTTQMIACESFQDCSKVTAIAIPSSVYEIGGYAFYNCSALTQVALPERIKTINDYLFYNCRSLSSIVIPDSVTRINYYAFAYCQGLTSLAFPAGLQSMGGELLQGCTNLQSILWNVRTYNSIPKNNSWNDPLYYVRSQVTEFTFGDSVRIIPNNLCYNMDKLTSLSLGCNITSIGTAFDGCMNIKSVHWNLRSCKEPEIYIQAPFYALRDSITEFTFGDSVRMIPNYLCHSMKRLRQLHIPEYVASIGAYSFRYVEALDSISVDENNNYYDSRNHCNALIESSSDKLLLGCHKTIIPEDISTIGECAFRNVRNLRSVVLSDNVSSIGKEAFNGCKEMEELVLPEELETIDDYTFQDCDSLQSLTLPASVNTIGLRAFANCTHMKAVNCTASTPPTIDATSFSGTTCSFYVPCANIAGYRSAPVWSDFGNRLAGEALYTLTVHPNEYAFGVVNVLQKPDCEHTAIIEATPSRGYEFVAWQEESGRELSTDAYYEFALEADLNIIGVFRRITEGFENIWAEGTAVWYDMMGHRVDEPTHGVYIVQTGSETRKVVIP